MQKQLSAKALRLASGFEKAKSRPDIFFDEWTQSRRYRQYVFQSPSLALTVPRASNSWKFPGLSREILQWSQASPRWNTSGCNPYESVPGLDSYSVQNLNVEFFLSSFNLPCFQFGCECEIKCFTSLELACARKNFWGQYMDFGHIKGIGGPGAPHAFLLQRLEDSGPHLLIIEKNWFPIWWIDCSEWRWV